MFEKAELIEIGNLEIDAAGDGLIGIRLKTQDGRILTVRGLTEDECKIIAKFWGDSLILDLRVA